MYRSMPTSDYYNRRATASSDVLHQQYSNMSMTSPAEVDSEQSYTVVSSMKTTPATSTNTTPEKDAHKGDRKLFADQLRQLQEQAASRNGGKAPSMSDHPAFRQEKQQQQQQQTVPVKRKPLPISKTTPPIEFPSTLRQAKATPSAGQPVVAAPHSQVDADPIAIAASRAAAQRIKRKTIPRPISIIVPLPTFAPRTGRGSRLTPLSSGSHYAAQTTPWKEKYGRNASLRTPKTGNTMKAALKGFGKEWMAQLNDAPAAQQPALFPEQRPSNDWERIKEAHGKYKDQQFDKKRAAAIEAARSAKAAGPPAVSSGITKAELWKALPVSPRSPKYPVRRISLTRLQTMTSDYVPPARTPLTSRFFNALKTPKTPKTPKLPTFRRPSIFQPRSRSGSASTAAGPKTPRTPRTPLSARLGSFFSSFSRKASSAATEAAAAATRAHVDASVKHEMKLDEERRKKMKAAISRPSADGRVFDADVFDLVLVAKREEEFKKAKEINIVFPSVGPNGEKRGTRIADFIEVGKGTHPLLKQQQQASAAADNRDTFVRHAAKLFTSSNTSSAKIKGKSAADHTKSKASLSTKLTDFSARLTRKSSTDSAMSFACAGDHDLNENYSPKHEHDAAAEPREASRCYYCGVPAFGLPAGGGCCDDCARGGQTQSQEYWPKRDASLPRSTIAPFAAAPASRGGAPRTSRFYPSQHNAFAPTSGFRGTLADHGNPYIIDKTWDSDSSSWLDTRSEKAKKMTRQEEDVAWWKSGSVGSPATAKKVGEVKRDTEFYGYYDEILVESPAPKWI